MDKIIFISPNADSTILFYTGLMMDTPLLFPEKGGHITLFLENCVSKKSVNYKKAALHIESISNVISALGIPFIRLADNKEEAEVVFTFTSKFPKDVKPKRKSVFMGWSVTEHSAEFIIKSIELIKTTGKKLRTMQRDKIPHLASKKQAWEVLLHEPFIDHCCLLVAIKSIMKEIEDDAKF